MFFISTLKGAGNENERGSSLGLLVLCSLREQFRDVKAARGITWLTLIQCKQIYFYHAVALRAIFMKACDTKKKSEHSLRASALCTCFTYDEIDTYVALLRVQICRLI